MLKKSRFAQNILHIATGSALSQVILLGSTPLLTRLFDATEFGALTLFTSAYAFMAAILTLKYDYSIILPQDARVAQELTLLCLLLSLAMAIAATTILLAAKYGFNLDIAWYFFLVPVTSLIGAAYTCAQQWAARYRDYRRSSKSQVVNSTVNVAVVLALAGLGGSYIGHLVIGYMVGLTAATIYLTFRSWRYFFGLKGWTTELCALLDKAREFKRFPLFVFPSFLLATAGVNTTPFVLRGLFRLDEVGYYAIANRFLLAPSALVGGAVSEAFRAEFVAQQKSGGDATRLFNSTLRSLLLVGVPSFGTFMLIAPTLFELLLGPAFRHSGEVVRYIGLGVFAQFVAQPFQYVFVATGRVKTGLVVQGGATIVPLLGLVFGGLMGAGMTQSLFYGAILSAISSAMLVWMAHRCCKKNGTSAAGISEHA